MRKITVNKYRRFAVVFRSLYSNSQRGFQISNNTNHNTRCLYGVANITTNGTMRKTVLNVVLNCKFINHTHAAGNMN